LRSGSGWRARRFLSVSLSFTRLEATGLESLTPLLRGSGGGIYVLEFADGSQYVGQAVLIDRSTPGAPVRVCPGCGQGSLTLRTSRYGPFYGCSPIPSLPTQGPNRLGGQSPGGP
jgi:hypothetical protein